MSAEELRRLQAKVGTDDGDEFILLVKQFEKWYADQTKEIDKLAFERQFDKAEELQKKVGKNKERVESMFAMRKKVDKLYEDDKVEEAGKENIRFNEIKDNLKSDCSLSDPQPREENNTMKGEMCKLRKELIRVAEQKHEDRKNLVEMIDKINKTFADNYRPSTEIPSPIGDDGRLDSAWVQTVPELWQELTDQRDRLKEEIGKLRKEKETLLIESNQVAEAQKRMAEDFRNIVKSTDASFA